MPGRSVQDTPVEARASLGMDAARSRRPLLSGVASESAANVERCTRRPLSVTCGADVARGVLARRLLSRPGERSSPGSDMRSGRSSEALMAACTASALGAAAPPICATSSALRRRCTNDVYAGTARCRGLCVESELERDTAECAESSV